MEVDGSDAVPFQFGDFFCFSRELFKVCMYDVIMLSSEAYDEMGPHFLAPLDWQALPRIEVAKLIPQFFKFKLMLQKSGEHHHKM